MKALEQENARLERMHADMAHENAAIKDVLNRTLLGGCASTPKFPQLMYGHIPAVAGISWRGCPRAARPGWD